MNIAVTVALLPALFTGEGDESPSATTVLISAPATTVPPAPTSTTTVTAPPTTAPPTTATTEAHVHTYAAAAATTTTAAPTTTTTAAPRPKPEPTTATAPPPPPPPPARQGNAEEGRATWYELEGARAGICAHKTLPFGTIATVTNTNTGSSIQCEVGDRGPFVDGYIIDLFRTDFEKLQPTSKGWFPARITW